MLSDTSQSGWNDFYRKMWEHPTRPMLPHELSGMTYQQLILVLLPKMSIEDLKAVHERGE